MRRIVVLCAIAAASCSSRHITGEADVAGDLVDGRVILDAATDPSDPGDDDVAGDPVGDPDGLDAPEDGDTAVVDVVADDPVHACDATDPFVGCAETGGSLIFPLCCPGASDFPESCTWDPCGCPEIESHNVVACDCGEGRCFDGMCCVDA